jgi:hypothetical protein
MIKVLLCVFDGDFGLTAANHTVVPLPQLDRGCVLMRGAHGTLLVARFAARVYYLSLDHHGGWQAYDSGRVVRDAHNFGLGVHLDVGIEDGIVLMPDA